MQAGARSACSGGRPPGRVAVARRGLGIGGLGQRHGPLQARDSRARYEVALTVALKVDAPMAWDFKTDPEFQEKLDWMETFVRDEIFPLEIARRRVAHAGGARRARQDHRPAEGGGQATRACGPPTCRRTWAASASARSSSA